MCTIYKFIEENNRVTEIKADTLYTAIDEFTNQTLFFEVDDLTALSDDFHEVVIVNVYPHKPTYKRTTSNLINYLIKRGLDEDEAFDKVDNFLNETLGYDNRCYVDYEILVGTLYRDFLRYCFN